MSSSRTDRRGRVAVPLVIALVIVALLLLFMWISVGREPGPGPSDVAIAYERAWDELDFGLLYDLSGAELRDGLRRDQFVAAKRAAYAAADKRARIGAVITVETAVAGHQTALVVTKVAAGGGAVRNNVMLDHTANGWAVIGYSLRPDNETAPPNAVVVTVAGVLLTGGASRRMQTDKARIVWKGETLAARGARPGRRLRSGDRGRLRCERASLRARGAARLRTVGGAGSGCARRRVERPRRATGVRPALRRTGDRAAARGLARCADGDPRCRRSVAVPRAHATAPTQSRGAEAAIGSGDHALRVAAGRHDELAEEQWRAVGPPNMFADVDTPSDLRSLGLS